MKKGIHQGFPIPARLCAWKISSRLFFNAGPIQLTLSTATKEERHYCQNNKDHKDYFCNVRSPSGNAAKTQYRGNNCNNEKANCVTKHFDSPSCLIDPQFILAIILWLAH
jgi:predicted transcriptional regulator